MAQIMRDEETNNALTIHQYYMDIINCIPSIVYWVDVHCKLQGCNKNFVKFLGLKNLHGFVGTPYEQMEKLPHWSKERIEAFRLDDMEVIFTGQPKYDIEESPVFNESGSPHYYLATRVPLYDKDKQVSGLVVILNDVTDRKNMDYALTSTIVPMVLHEQKRPPKILMVEDNYIAQKVEGALLRSLNCHVDIAESGDQALLFFEPGKYDMVFMDIGLQDTSGYMVAKKMRQKEKSTDFHVPIIALTSYQADVVKYDCNDYYMEGVLTKPLTVEQAKQIIQHFIYHESIPVNGLKSASMVSQRK